MDKTDLNKKDLLSLFLGILAIHMYVISFAAGSIILFCISLIDSLLAFFLGLRTNSDYGHIGLVIGMLVFILAAITMIAFFVG